MPAEIHRTFTTARTGPRSSSYNARTRRFTAIATSEVPVRGGILEMGGLDLGRFERGGGPLLSQHRGLPVGRVLSLTPTTIQVDGRRVRALEAVGQLAPRGASQASDEAAELLKSGDLRAVSVGFVVKSERPPTPSERERGATWVYNAAQLLELSLVAVPADETAMVRSGLPAATRRRRPLDTVAPHRHKLTDWDIDVLVAGLEALLPNPANFDVDEARRAAWSTSRSTPDLLDAARAASGLDEDELLEALDQIGDEPADIYDLYLGLD